MRTVGGVGPEQVDGRVSEHVFEYPQRCDTVLNVTLVAPNRSDERRLRLVWLAAVARTHGGTGPQLWRLVAPWCPRRFVSLAAKGTTPAPGESATRASFVRVTAVVQGGDMKRPNIKLN